MIHAKVMLDDDTPVVDLWLREKPSAGEYLWLTGDAHAEAMARFGAGSLRIKEVAHWVASTWRPGTHTGEPIHSLAIYVEPMR